MRSKNNKNMYAYQHIYFPYLLVYYNDVLQMNAYRATLIVKFFLKDFFGLPDQLLVHQVSYIYYFFHLVYKIYYSALNIHAK